MCAMKSFAFARVTSRRAIVLAGLLLASCDRQDGKARTGVQDLVDERATTEQVVREEERSPAASPTTLKSEVLAESHGHEDPRDVLLEVNKLRRAGRLVELESHIDEAQSSYVIDLIAAVDRVAAADNQLRHAVRKKLGSHIANTIDHGGIVNAIGPFSMDVRVVALKRTDDSYQATIQVGGRLPLETTTLISQGGRWKIRTDEPIPGVARALIDLANVLQATASRVESKPAGQLSAEAISRELTTRTAPILKRIDELTVS